MSWLSTEWYSTLLPESPWLPCKMTHSGASVSAAHRSPVRTVTWYTWTASKKQDKNCKAPIKFYLNHDIHVYSKQNTQLHVKGLYSTTCNSSCQKNSIFNQPGNVHVLIISIFSYLALHFENYPNCICTLCIIILKSWICIKGWEEIICSKLLPNITWIYFRNCCAYKIFRLWTCQANCDKYSKNSELFLYSFAFDSQYSSTVLKTSDSTSASMRSVHDTCMCTMGDFKYGVEAGAGVDNQTWASTSTLTYYRFKNPIGLKLELTFDC